MKTRNRNRIIAAILWAHVAAACVFYLTGCESLRIRGGIETEYGSVMSDGKNVTILLKPTRGFRK